MAEGPEDLFSGFTEVLFEDVERGGDLTNRQAALLDALEQLANRLHQAHDALPQEGWQDWRTRHRVAEALSDASLLALCLQDWLKPSSHSPLRLEFKHRPMGSKGVSRTGGRPIDWPKRKRRLLTENRAARLVERLVSRGDKKEWAVTKVVEREKCPVSRDAVFEGLRRRAKARELAPDANERELLSLIFLQ